MLRPALGIAVVLLLLGLLPWMPGPARAGDQQLEKQVRDILRQNPELLLEVIREHRGEVLRLVQQALREQRKKLWLKRIRAEIKKPRHPVLEPGRLYLGPPDAPITVVAYSNFMCSHCATGDRTARLLVKKYPGQVRLLLKHSVHDELAKRLALYFMAIGRQDPAKAWRFADLVFANQNKLRKKKDDELEKIVSRLGLDRKRLYQDLADPELSRRITADTEEHERFGFNSTPTFLINGVSLRGAVPLPAFEEVIKLLRGQAGAG